MTILHDNELNHARALWETRYDDVAGMDEREMLDGLHDMIWAHNVLQKHTREEIAIARADMEQWVAAEVKRRKV